MGECVVKSKDSYRRIKAQPYVADDSIVIFVFLSPAYGKSKNLVLLDDPMIKEGYVTFL